MRADDVGPLIAPLLSGHGEAATDEGRLEEALGGDLKGTGGLGLAMHELQSVPERRGK